MRDPNRIWVFCMKLAQLWSQTPDLRFGQLVECVKHEISKGGRDPFYVEEEEMMSYFESFIGRKT